MTGNILRKLNTPLAHEVAEHVLLQEDMKSSLDAMRLWSEKYAERLPGTEEGIIGKSLFRDAIIQFVGCFDKSAKYPLSPDDVYGPTNNLPLFEWFKNMRDAYAAHKFGAQRQCIAGVMQHPQHGLGIVSCTRLTGASEKATALS
jgi:hypothetical protein